MSQFVLTTALIVLMMETTNPATPVMDTSRAPA